MSINLLYLRDGLCFHGGLMLRKLIMRMDLLGFFGLGPLSQLYLYFLTFSLGFDGGRDHRESHHFPLIVPPGEGIKEMKLRALIKIF